MWVFRRFGFSDSVMDKIAFNNPYRFAGGDIPWRSDLVGKQRLLTRGEFGDAGRITRHQREELALISEIVFVTFRN